MVVLIGQVLIASSPRQAMAADAKANTPAYGATEGLSLADYLQQVVERNKGIQSHLMAFQSAWSLKKAEGGLFEPAFVGSAEYDDHKRANTIEIERQLQSGGEFDEINRLYTAALEFLTPMGAKVRVGASANRLHNNIQHTVVVNLDAEFQTNVGISVEQPLLKDAGPTAVYSGLRLATRNAEASFQDYRRQMMQTIGEAEMAYWQLYYAQEEFRLSRESVTMAKTLADDAREKFDAGRGSRLDMLEAEAGLSVRHTRESEARQKWVDALNHFASYFDQSPQTASVDYVATDAPVPQKIELPFEANSRRALAMSPDRLKAEAVLAQEKVRVAYARNQRLPELNLKSSFFAGGLGYDWHTSLKDIKGAKFPEWTISLEWRVPIWGGIRERNQLQAAKYRMRQAELNAKEVENQLATGLDTAQQRIVSTYDAAQNYVSVVSFRDNLLKSQIDSAEIGRSNTKDVLEAEQDLFDARLGLLQSQVENARAVLELQILSGSLLNARHIDVGMKKLQGETAQWAEDGGGPLNVLNYSVPTEAELNSKDFINFPQEELNLRKKPKRHFWQLKR